MFTEFRPLSLEPDSSLALSAMQLICDQVWGYAFSPAEHLVQQRRQAADFYTLTCGDELLAVGSLLLYRYTAIATIGILAVNPAYQWKEGGVRFGFGSETLHNLELEAKHKDISPQIQCIRVTALTTAIPFYQKRGYTLTSQEGSRLLYKHLR